MTTPKELQDALAESVQRQRKVQDSARRVSRSLAAEDAAIESTDEEQPDRRPELSP